VITNRVEGGSGLNTLKRKLAQLGGPKGMPSDAMYQASNDPDLMQIVQYGKLYKRVTKRYTGRDAECHWNVAKLFKMGYIDTICVGYAQNEEGWHQHTWGLLDGGVVETTPSNFENSAWFGVPLNEDECKWFVLKCKRNKPGMGMIRTRQGGAVVLRT
jgi:hypothetical protein